MSEICHELHQWANNRCRYAFPFESHDIPRNGIYILFEKGELAHGGDRIVRVGTHRGQGLLPSRLKEHFLKKNKDRSIFRKNIGRALLKKGNDPFAGPWDLDLMTREAKLRYAGTFDLGRQREVEDDVSRCIQSSFSFIVFGVQEPSTRLRLESRLIATVSLCEYCQKSADWLGNHSPKQKIRDSGLWLVNELYKEPLNAEDLLVLRDCQ